ncbi:hypothetical protein ACL655_20425 [Klebsiella quasipneumoniae subsp. similipneumoniae]
MKLLQNRYPEADNYAGFPVGSSFLMTETRRSPQHLEKVWPGFSRRRRCRCRTLMHVTSTVSAWCCSGHSPPSRPSS